MKTSIGLAFVAAIVYVITYTAIQGYYNREVSMSEVLIGGIIFLLAFAGTHALISRLRK